MRGYDRQHLGAANDAANSVRFGYPGCDIGDPPTGSICSSLRLGFSADIRGKGAPAHVPAPKDLAVAQMLPNRRLATPSWLDD